MKTLRTSLFLAIAAGVTTLTATAQQPQVNAARLQLPRGLTDSAVRQHVISPAHIQGVRLAEVDEKKEVRLRLSGVPKAFKKSPHLDVTAFATVMHAALKDSCNGYTLQVRQNGNVVYNLIWSWAQTPSDKSVGWSTKTRMHIASVSKLMTAIGMVHALDKHGISYDAKIVDYLPSYWAKGTNINKITFRHLLTHTSGFSTGSSASDYLFMKSKVAAGVSKVGSYDYENMNFGLCRLLIPIINGDIPKTATFLDGAINDQSWDAVALFHYKNYMQENVFSPSGVRNAGFAPANGNALAYTYQGGSKKGWDSGDLAAVAGGAGWRLSVEDVLNVMDHFRRRGDILPASKAQYVLDNYFGIDQALDTPAGKIYNKNGGWGTGAGTEQCVAYFLPGNMEVVCFVNSPIGSQNYSLRGLVKDAFVNSLEE